MALNARKLSRSSVEMAFQCYIYYKPAGKYIFSNIKKTWAFAYVASIFLKIALQNILIMDS